jgi:predicted nucleic acid-binding protein
MRLRVCTRSVRTRDGETNADLCRRAAHQIGCAQAERVRGAHPTWLLETHETGLALATRYSLSLYDAMIAASALGAGCSTLWSEDMQDGLLIEQRLRVRNPF